MKPTVIITIATVVLAIAAGVAIAGLPSSEPGAEVTVLEVPTVETRPVPTIAAATIAPLPTTTTTTLVPETTTTVAGSATTDPSVPDSVESTSTTQPNPADALRERGTLSVATANATDLSGVATAHADELEALGYVDVAPVDSAVSQTSAVYYQPGFELEAARLAIDLGWDPVALGPMSEAPNLQTDATFELVAVVGLDET